MARLREVKDEAEIAAVRRACDVAVEALRAVVARGLVGRTEADVAWQIKEEYTASAPRSEAFAAIVAAGDHGALAHAIPGARRIGPGELVVIDTGARVDGYCSDITRTFAAGELDEELRRIYDVVLAAQLAGLAAVRPGATGRDVDAAARGVIDAAGYGEPSATAPGTASVSRCTRSRASAAAAPGASGPAWCCTVEPGIYLEGRGGVRIEDTVLVTDDGGERLTTFPKELTVAG